MGALRQIPPAYSAIHVDGKRAYERILAGEELELKPRPVVIRRLELEEWSEPDMRVIMECSSGTYVRSFARDIGLACGSAAHLVGLRRSRVGDFLVEDALPGTAARENGLSSPIPGSWFEERRLGELVPDLQKIELAPAFLADFRQGKMIRDVWFNQDASFFTANALGQDYAVLCGAYFPGIVQRDARGWSYRLVFPARVDS
jgi:tRNA U55 pseudouridine synthase TruB